MMMLTTENLINKNLNALMNDNFVQLHQNHVELLKAYFPQYRYSQFRSDTNRAIKPLAEMPQLLAYQAFYMVDHFNRFSYMLNQLPIGQQKKQGIRLKIFDYGCGQGLATLAFLQHLKQKNQQLELEIHLIEPSNTALELAKHYVDIYAHSHLSGQVKVISHECGLDQLDHQLFCLDHQQWAVHLFSNILDMAGHGIFDLQRLTQQWQMMQGKQLCLAVSPDCVSTTYGFKLILKCMQFNQLINCNFSCSSLGYRIYTNWQGMQQYHVHGRMLAFKFETTPTPLQQVA